MILSALIDTISGKRSGQASEQDLQVANLVKGMSTGALAVAAMPAAAKSMATQVGHTLKDFTSNTYANMSNAATGTLARVDTPAEGIALVQGANQTAGASIG